MLLKTSPARATVLCALIVSLLNATATAQFYRKSYALVIGINTYPSTVWQDLSYARKDAESMARLLKTQGFETIPLYDAQATRDAIIAQMQNYLAPLVESGDRVLVFFAGHGYTERLNEVDRGYIVPYDGNDKSATYISMEQLQELSDKMGRATHQLFIIDACFGGLLGTRDGGGNRTPLYVSDLLKRPARQILTAGGKDQRVLDGGSGGNSLFTGALLEALKDGLADFTPDGYITFNELCSYMQTRASNNSQTPLSCNLPRHGGGEFIFSSPRSSYRQLPQEAQHPLSSRSKPEYALRSKPDINFSQDDQNRMLHARGYFEHYHNPAGTGIVHKYVRQLLAGETVLLDNATGLMWQQSGSLNALTFIEVEDYIKRLSNNRFAGFDDWRLPTLEEAMSLMESTEENGDLYIAPIFDRKQTSIWTADMKQAALAWFVDFDYGSCTFVRINNGKYKHYVRVVRINQ